MWEGQEQLHFRDLSTAFLRLGLGCMVLLSQQALLGCLGRALKGLGRLLSQQAFLGGLGRALKGLGRLLSQQAFLGGLGRALKWLGRLLSLLLLFCLHKIVLRCALWLLLLHRFPLGLPSLGHDGYWPLGDNVTCTVLVLSFFRLLMRDVHIVRHVVSRGGPAGPGVGPVCGPPVPY